MKHKIVVILLLGGFTFSCNSQQKAPPTSTPIDTGYTYKKASNDGIGKFYWGREISHVMGAGGTDWLERTERNEEENTSLAISNIQLAPNAVVADIGAGTGYYSFKLAAKVPQGKVYAVDMLI
jgi:2-polyprenyl-3-methyl-5-hydroxy-6-metoxy-1,4-benzoquinol methylase